MYIYIYIYTNAWHVRNMEHVKQSYMYYICMICQELIAVHPDGYVKQSYMRYIYIHICMTCQEYVKQTHMPYIYIYIYVYTHDMSGIWNQNGITTAATKLAMNSSHFGVSELADVSDCGHSLTGRYGRNGFLDGLLISSSQYRS